MICILTKLGRATMPHTVEEMKEFWHKLGHETTDSGEPIAKTTKFSLTELEAVGKTTMAHVMVDLGLFSSVKQAKNNGWNKPLEIGLHEVTKKKIKFEIL